MISIYAVGSAANSQEIIRDTNTLGQLTRQVPCIKRHTVPSIWLESVRNGCKSLRSTRTIFFHTDVVMLLEDELARLVDGDESPGGNVDIWWEVDLLCPFVAEFKWKRELLMHTTAAAVRMSPVGRIAHEVKDCFGGMLEDRL